MKIVLISDTHNKHGFLMSSDLPDADMIIHAGDISGRGLRQEVENFLYWYSSLDKYKYKILIAGNHDWFFERNSELVWSIIPDNVIYLENNGINIEGINIWGSPITPSFYNWAFNKDRGNEIKRYWDMIPDETDILITHGPPYKILDNVPNGRFQKPYNDEDNVGCVDLLNRIKELKNLKLHVFGHIHEQYGETIIDCVTHVNASQLNDDYKLVNKPIIYYYDSYR